jgi:hypothetical protein
MTLRALRPCSFVVSVLAASCVSALIGPAKATTVVYTIDGGFQSTNITISGTVTFVTNPIAGLEDALIVSDGFVFSSPLSLGPNSFETESGPGFVLTILTASTLENLALFPHDEQLTGGSLIDHNGEFTRLIGFLTPLSIIEDTPSAVPLPGALLLFASGLGALGLFGWGRKRKCAPALAA